MAKHRKLKVGDIVEHLQILEFTGVKQIGVKRSNFCICRCLLCGNTIEIPVPYVGRVYKSCGCLQQKTRCNDIAPDTVFGRLKVIERTEEKKHDCYLYRCTCACDGKEVLVRSDLLRDGSVRSCGCLHDELFRKNTEKAYQNNFVFDTNIPKIKNTKIQSNNTSGVTGVSYHKKVRKWQASISFRGINYHLGYFDDLKDAANIRKIAKQELHGDFLKWYSEFKKMQKGGCKMFINFKLFAQLYAEAQNCDDVDMYVAERGWQDWMDEYADDQIVDILHTIYKMAKMSFIDLRNFGGYSSRTLFCNVFKIPSKTVQKWDYEVSTTADYTKMFIAYILFIKADKELRDE